MGMGRRARTRERERGRHSGTDSLVRPGAVRGGPPGRAGRHAGREGRPKEGCLGARGWGPTEPDFGGHTDGRTHCFKAAHALCG